MLKQTRGRIGNSEAADALADVTHPIVISHPESDKQALYVNPGFTIGIKDLPPNESEKLLQELYLYAIKDENMTKFKWRPGSIAFWDNRATWHYALNDYPGERRLMHRITVEVLGLAAERMQPYVGGPDVHVPVVLVHVRRRYVRTQLPIDLSPQAQ